MTLRPRLGPEPPIKVHTPPDIRQYEIPPCSIVQRIQRLHPAEEGETLQEDVGEPGVGLAEPVAGDGAVGVDK